MISDESSTWDIGVPMDDNDGIAGHVDSVDSTDDNILLNDDDFLIIDDGSEDSNQFLNELISEIESGLPDELPGNDYQHHSVDLDSGGTIDTIIFNSEAESDGVFDLVNIFDDIDPTDLPDSEK